MFVIRESVPGPVPKYKVEEWDGTPLKGMFYKEDLQKVNMKVNNTFRIEKNCQANRKYNLVTM